MTAGERTARHTPTRRDKGGRPKTAAVPKVTLSVRVDPEVVERLRASGDGWQKRVNDLLRKDVGL